MNRTNVLTIVAALVCITSMSLVASTLLSAQAIGSNGEASPIETQRPMDMIGQDDPNDPADEAGNTTFDEGSDMSGITTCVPALDTPAALIGILAAFCGLLFLIYQRFNVAISMLTGWTIFPPIMLVYFIFTDCSSRDDGGIGGISGGAVPIENAGSQLVPLSDVPVWVIPLLAGTIVVGAAFVLYRSAGEDEIVIPDDEDGEDDPDLDSFAQAAGRAADRIEQHDADADNAVYQAWVEMTGLLNVDRPETYTAGEFADAATDLGMASSDVSELTTLFNEVRYGGKDAQTREDRAVGILRKIESQYREEAETTDSSSATGTDTDVDTDTDQTVRDTDDTNEGDSR